MFALYSPVPGCVGLPKIGSKNLVLVVLRQIGAKDFTMNLHKVDKYKKMLMFFVTEKPNFSFSFVRIMCS